MKNIALLLVIDVQKVYSLNHGTDPFRRLCPYFKDRGISKSIKRISLMEMFEIYENLPHIVRPIQQRGSGLEMTHFFNNKKVLMENVLFQDPL